MKVKLTESEIKEDEAITHNIKAALAEEEERKIAKFEKAKADLIRVKREVKKIKKKHQLYFRTHGGEIRNLLNVNEDIYGIVIVAFIKGDAEKRYAELNKEVKHWSDFQPVPVMVPIIYKESFNKVTALTKTKFIEVAYNGTWKPLATLMLEEAALTLEEVA